MIKIRGNFIQASDKAWHNIKNIRCLYLEGTEEVGYRIGFSFEHDYRPLSQMNFDHMAIGETHKKEKDAQAQLDGIMELLEYDKS